MAAVLKMVGITKRFPGVIANELVDFELNQGETHALLGENGAGKTTLMNILYGLYEPDEGEIFIHGQKIKIRSPNDAIAAGIGMVHQHFKLVPTLTVAENITLGREITWGPMLRQKEAVNKIQEISQEFGIDVSPHKKVIDLSVGEMQRVEILKVLYRGANILILDEPTAVLTPPEVEPLFLTLKAMVERGKSIIFISHKLREVFALAGRVTVLRRGKLIDTVNTAGTTETQLAQMMVGRDVVLSVSRKEREDDVGKVVAALKHVHVMGNHGQLAVKNIDLDIRANEIVCIAGVDGNGQSDLAEALAGIRAVKEGHIFLEGKEITHASVVERNEAGLWYIPADRNQRGAAVDLTLEMNTILKHHRWKPYSKFGILAKDPIRQLTNRLVQEYDVRCASTLDRAATLSGGNLQKLIVARETFSSPRLLIAEQPTRGLDVSAIEFVRRLLLKERDEGAAVLLISADLDEVMALADRIVVMYEGRIVYECIREDVLMDKLGLAMAGFPQDAPAPPSIAGEHKE
jgi:ABC-type uncharacterized transport system ATPase subunit